MAEKKKTSDTVKPTVTFAKLKKEIAPVEEFSIGFPDGKIVKFPDIFGMDEEKADELFRRCANGTPMPSDVLPLWLSKEDWEYLRAQKFSLRELLVIFEAANQHYQVHQGTLGEGLASHS